MCSLNTHCTRMHLAQGSLSTLSSPMLSFHSWWLTYAEFVPQSWKSRRWYWTHNIIPLINLKSWRWYRAHLPISPRKPFWSHPRCWGCQIDHEGEWLKAGLRLVNIFGFKGFASFYITSWKLHKLAYNVGLKLKKYQNQFGQEGPPNLGNAQIKEKVFFWEGFP